MFKLRIHQKSLKWLILLVMVTYIYHCIHHHPFKKQESLKILPLLSKDFLGFENAVFFIETNSSELELKPRLVCAIERVASLYPKRPIMVILTQLKIIGLPPFISDLKNVHFRSIDIDAFVQGSAVEGLWKSGKVKSSIWSLSNISNLLRFLVVFKFGGLYLDHDVIALKPISEAETNFVCLVHSNRVASAVFQLRKDHPLLKLALERMAQTFRGDLWGHNGPDLLTKATIQYCAKHGLQTLFEIHCPDLKIQSPQFATPFQCPEYDKFYQPKYDSKIQKGIGQSHFLHYCNKKRSGTQNPNATDPYIMRSNQPLYRIMKEACPMTEEKILHFQNLNESVQDQAILQMPNSVDAIQICQRWNQFQIDRKSFWAKPTRDMYSLRPKFQSIHHKRWKLDRTQEPFVLIFNRNRKTGSSYVIWLLWKLSQKLHFRMHNLNLGDAPYSSLSQLQEQQLVKKMSSSPGHHSTLFWNHFFFIDTSIYNRSWNSNWINFVRHPIDWFMSDFYYRRRPSRAWENQIKPPQEWFERDAEHCILEQDPECFFQEGQYRIQQLSYFCGNALECRKVGSYEALKRAISVVDMYYSVVGITEDMIGSLSIMEVMLPRFFSGFRSLLVNEVINGHPHERNISASAKRKLEEMFHYDMMFYQFAKRRLNNQMRILNISGMNRNGVRTSFK